MTGIIIVGLGPGDPASITRAAWETITGTKELFLRTKYHPAVPYLPDTVELHSFDSLYETSESYEDVYQAIIREIIGNAEKSTVVYAVPGDPMVGETTGTGLIAEASRRGIPCRILPGISFMEVCLRALQLDALDGLVLVDALDVNQRSYPPFSTDTPVLISQVYSRMVASDLKLTLMTRYPDEHVVTLIHAAGSEKEELEQIPLFELDHSTKIASMTTLYVPSRGESASLETFAETIALLRAPDGCPWDQEQTHQSLRPHLLEEAYEALQALDDDDMDALQEELGDLLLQIILHAQIATEEEEFTLSDVIAGINRKIIRRHPHVFSQLKLENTEDVLVNWERIKSEEQEGKKGLLTGIPRALPALSQAQKIQQRARRVGFDWNDIHGVRRKIAEEFSELDNAETLNEQKMELGDILFSIVNLARWMDLDAEDALRETNRKFRSRFAAVEERVREQGRSFSDLSTEEMDELWEEVKRDDAI
ncbi:MAG: nucleoside triphosphate pyrophosphohydrolase [Anaerolineales bacterium]|nr:nucleoside triphosphate pyrophosphohydrolase [Anaerolineales bacterium]